MTDPHPNRTAQQGTERRHIEAFLAIIGITPNAVEHGDRPDAVLVVGGRRIGLEHRELTEQDLASNERNLLVLESRLQEEMVRLAVPSDIQVAVTVDATAPIFRKRRQVETLATNIAKCAAAKAADVAVDASARIPASDVAPADSLGADLLVLTRHPRLHDGPYAIISPAFWGPVNQTILAAVPEKEALLASYRAGQRLDEVWLLLVTGENWMQATDSVLAEYTHIETEFDRVYLLDLRKHTAKRLDVPTPSSAPP